jgi:hypothetical protein
VQGGFFLRKKPLGILLSLYTNWKNTLAVAGGFLCVTRAFMRRRENRPQCGEKVGR